MFTAKELELCVLACNTVNSSVRL